MAAFKLARWSAGAGGVVWLGLAAGAQAGALPLDVIERMFLLAPLVVVPLCLPLAAGPSSPAAVRFLRWAAWAQPFGAVLAVLSFFLPRGPAGALPALGWTGVTGLVGLAGACRFLRKEWLDLPGACLTAGFLFLPVGGFWLFGSRLGLTPAGFQEPIVLLTAVHFHFTGFAAPVLAGFVGRALADGPPAARAAFAFTAAGVIAGPPALAAGFVFSPVLKAAAALFLAAALIGLGALHCAVLASLARFEARVLLAISSLSIWVGMALASVYAASEFAGRPLIGIPEMAVWHGISNGIGFSLCGILAWTVNTAGGGGPGDGKTIPTPSHRMEGKTHVPGA